MSQQDQVFKGLRVLLTGGSRGLGEALAVALARRGARIVMVARGEAELGRVCARIAAEGGQVIAIATDVADKEAVHRIAARAASAFTEDGAPGGVDILIHNAATLGPSPLELLLDTDCEDLERAFAVNVLGPFRLTKAVLGHMVLAQRGLVAAVTSDAAVHAYPTWGAYGASKAALEHVITTFAAENEASGVRFVLVDPGELDTRMHAEALPDADRDTLTPPEVAADRMLLALGAALAGGPTLRRIQQGEQGELGGV